MSWLIIIGVILFGIVVVAIEVFFVPGTTIVGLAGFLLEGFGVYLAYSDFGTSVGHITLASTIAFTAILIFIGFRSNAWGVFANKQELQVGFDDLDKGFEVGMEGKTLSALRPSGKVDFGAKEAEVHALSGFVDRNEKVVIVKLDKNKIFVNPLKSE